MDYALALLEKEAELSVPEVLEPAELQIEPRKQKVGPPLKIFVAIQVLFTLLCGVAEFFAKFVLHLAAPYTYPLKTASQTDWDFTLFLEQFQYFHRPEFFRIREFPYPAPAAVAYAIFFSYRAHPLRFFVGFILMSSALAGLLLGIALCRRGASALQSASFIIATLLMSFPLWFELKQGNIEICVWVLVALGVWAFCKDKGYTAAACFGIAGSMKIFPFVYLGLLLTQRKYREMIFAGFAAASSSLISLWLVGPNLLQSWRYIEASLASFRFTYLLHFRDEEVGFDHSLFGIYKRFSHHLPPPAQLGHIVNTYLAIAAICGITLYFLRIRHLPRINQILCLTIASILLPPISYEYTLLYLYIPWAMLVLFAQDQFVRYPETRYKIPSLSTAFVCLAIVMSPLSEFIHHTTRFGGQIKALVLALLMLIGLVYPFASQTNSKSGRSLAA